MTIHVYKKNPIGIFLKNYLWEQFFFSISKVCILSAHDNQFSTTYLSWHAITSTQVLCVFLFSFTTLYITMFCHLLYTSMMVNKINLRYKDQLIPTQCKFCLTTDITHINEHPYCSNCCNSIIFVHGHNQPSIGKKKLRDAFRKKKKIWEMLEFYVM
jgi:hypothetical protein